MVSEKWGTQVPIYVEDNCMDKTIILGIVANGTYEYEITDETVFSENHTNAQIDDYRWQSVNGEVVTSLASYLSSIGLNHENYKKIVDNNKFLAVLNEKVADKGYKFTKITIDNIALKDEEDVKLKCDKEAKEKEDVATTGTVDTTTTSTEAKSDFNPLPLIIIIAIILIIIAIITILIIKKSKKNPPTTPEAPTQTPPVANPYQ